MRSTPRSFRRRARRRGGSAPLGSAAAPPLPPPVSGADAGDPQGYTPVTAERLRTPADGDWLMIRRTYDGWGYSPLEQITPANVAGCSRCGSFCDRRQQRPRGGADRQQRRDVRLDAGQPGDRDRREDRRRCCGATASRRRRERRSRCIRPAAASRSTATRSSSPPDEAVLVALDARTGEEVVDREGRGQQATATTCRWRRSSPTAR